MGHSAETQFHGNNNTEQDIESFSYAMQLVDSTVLPVSLHAAVQLEVFEIIAKVGPDAKPSPQERAAQLTTQNPDAPLMLDSMLRLIAIHSVLGCSLDVDHEQGDPKMLNNLASVVDTITCISTCHQWRPPSITSDRKSVV